jgi:hypothetical protein
MFGDGHVEFNQTPFCGVQQDGIYGPATPPASGVTTYSPKMLVTTAPLGHKDDTCLLPVVEGGTP